MCLVAVVLARNLKMQVACESLRNPRCEIKNIADKESAQVFVPSTSPLNPCFFLSVFSFGLTICGSLVLLLQFRPNATLVNRLFFVFRNPCCIFCSISVESKVIYVEKKCFMIIYINF